jgi:hypothetical protein
VVAYLKLGSETFCFYRRRFKKKVGEIRIENVEMSNENQVNKLDRRMTKVFFESYFAKK